MLKSDWVFSYSLNPLIELGEFFLSIELTVKTTIENANSKKYFIK